MVFSCLTWNSSMAHQRQSTATFQRFPHLPGKSVQYTRSELQTLDTFAKFESADPAHAISLRSRLMQQGWDPPQLKVLSVGEPHCTLLDNKIKKVENRKQSLDDVFNQGAGNGVLVYLHHAKSRCNRTDTAMYDTEYARKLLRITHFKQRSMQSIRKKIDTDCRDHIFKVILFVQKPRNGIEYECYNQPVETSHHWYAWCIRSLTLPVHGHRGQQGATKPKCVKESASYCAQCNTAFLQYILRLFLPVCYIYHYSSSININLIQIWIIFIHSLAP